MSIRCDYNALVSRGALDYGDFYIWKCKACGAYAVYDEENCLIYMNPSNFSVFQLYAITGTENVPCPTCSTTQSFEPAPDEDYPYLLNSKWKFVVKTEQLRSKKTN